MSSGRRLWPRRQPPTYSPLSSGALVRALHVALTPKDPRTALAELLRATYDGHAVLCSSGTDALTRAITVADDMSGGSRHVALPAYGCYDLATAVVGADVRLSLYDLDPATLAPELSSVRETLQRGARVVVCAPLYGLAVDWTALTALADEYGAVVVEDAAQAFGTTWRGRPLGSLGVVSVLSFGRGKGWTGSHGGALLARGAATEALASRVPSLVRGELPPASGLGDVFTATAQHLLGHPGTYALPASLPWLGLGETRYREPSVSAEMSRASAALLLASRERALSEVAIRRNTAAWYGERLHSTPTVLCLATSPDDAPGYLRYPVRIPGGFAGLRDRRLAGALGVAPAYPTLLSSLPAIRARLVAEQPLEGAAVVQRELVTLPTHSQLSLDERNAIATLLADTARAGQRAMTMPSRDDASHVRVEATAGSSTAGGT